jgi:RimJ/RimL family protein N-acetyltransferase
MKIPTLKAQRLILRPFEEGDADPLHCILSEEGILRYFPNPDPPPLERVERLVAHQLKHWEEHGLGWWAVEPLRNPGLIGWAGLQFLPETGETEVAYLLSRVYWGQGLATEAARASLQFGFEQLKLETIIALAHPENKASQRVMEKLGMSFVDQAHYFGIDLYRYTLTASSWRSAGWL